MVLTKAIEWTDESDAANAEPASHAARVRRARRQRRAERPPDTRVYGWRSVEREAAGERLGHKNCKVIHQLRSPWLVIYYPYTIGSNSEGSSWHQTPQCVRVFTISTNLYGNALQLHPEATSVHTRVTLEQIVHAPLARATSHTGTLPAHVRTHVPSPWRCRIPPPKNAPSPGSGLTLHGFRGPSPVLRAVVRLRAHAS
eukprot:scaffold54288_cov36-Phaeocystis_antarctica.AAC.1